MKRIFIITLVLAFILSSVTVMAGNLDDLRKQYNEAQEAVAETQEELDAIRTEMDLIHQAILELDARMIAATDDLLAIDQAIYITQDNLDAIETDWMAAHKALEHQHEIVRNRLRDIQMQGSTGLLSVVFQATSLRDFLLRIEYVNNIARSDQEMMRQLQEFEASVAQMQEDFTRHISTIESLRHQQEGYLQQLEDISAEQEAFFIELTQDEERYKALLAFEQEHAAAMHTKWYTAYQEEQARIAAEQLERERLEREAQIAQLPLLGGIFVWPVPSSGDISSHFGYRNHPLRRTREMHWGIDIRARSGSDILAADSGRVILAGRHGGYGYTVIIDHGGGLHTLYGHNSRNLVSVGDEVTRGQVIALIGSTGVSTGPHLHFEVRLNGTAIDPMPFLGR